MSDNYDKQVQISRALFTRYPQEEMIRKFRLQADKDFIYLPILNQICRISRSDGCIALRPAALENECWTESGDYNLVMTVYDVLCCSQPFPTLSHQWVPLFDLQVTMSSPSADRFTQKYADAFAGKLQQLQQVCRTIGGRPLTVLAGADLGWEFDLFPFFPVQLRYWEPDEEFPPQLKLLWDKNTLSFLHFETVYYAMHVLLHAIAKLL